MTTVGLVGGLGRESTIDYYRRIIEAWQRDDPSSAPSIVIDSLDLQHGIHLVETDREALIEYLMGSLRRLAGAGADFIAMTANTPHIVFDELDVQSPVSLVSIVDTCAQEAKRLGLTRLALLGTRFTMEGPFYPAVFERYGVEIVTPDKKNRDWVHDKYMNELLKGQFRDEVRTDVTALIGRVRDEEGIDGVILGGTELTILLSAPVIPDVPALDTTALHVNAIVKRLQQ